jgi:hypothetical protein
MMDEKTYEGVASLFFGKKWHNASCAVTAFGDDVFISLYPSGYLPLTMRMDIAMLVRVADVLRQHLPSEDEIEGCDEMDIDEMDIDDVIFNRLDELSEQVGLLQAEHVTRTNLQHTRDRLIALEQRVAKLEGPKPLNERHSGGFYVTEFPGLNDLRLYNLG